MSDSIAQTEQQRTSNHISCGDFLTALYRDVDPALWLELRCIDPLGVQKAKVLWSPLHKPAATLKQVQTLNGQGYGAYFAPCPRREKKGSAEYAAALPALWVDIDCDGESAKRESALTCLNAFDPSPSIIINSGGGWHSYWLLNEPYLLTGELERMHAASILKGLFAALGGDAEYVKSAASIMRLPGLVNTKPERNGAVVTVTQFEAERRYSLQEFEWLVIRPKLPEPTFIHIEGLAPLPVITLDYLNNGAAVKQRNHALFAAACQLRDAGYSQPDAEAQLVTRYVADGAGEPGREREAQATIASAYKRSPRDPIPHGEGPRQIDALLSNHTSAAKPTDSIDPAQLAQAITACAQLDPVAWAVERQRLKPVCTAAGLKAADLDRMYQHARRAAAREQKATAAPDAERYVEVENCMVYERPTERGLSRKTVANWTARVQEWITQINDDGKTDHVIRLELRHTDKLAVLDVPSELFGDNNALQRFIAAQVGGIYTVRAGMSKHLVPAILALSGTPTQRMAYRFVGWTRRDGHWAYVSPQVSVTAEGFTEQPPEVELETRLRDYGLADQEWPSSLSAFSALCAVLPKDLASPLLAFAMLPVVQRFFPVAAPRPAIHLIGTTGSGKSELAALLCSFYGDFTRDTPPAQWGDTVNTVETLGYALADALYWVDDYKSCYADERTFTRFLQSYSRGMGRGRLTREAKLRQERPCRGLLLSTGETMLEGEASVIARMLVLEVPPWEKRDPQGKALAEVERVRRHLPSFTAHFASWIAARADTKTLGKALANDFEASVQSFRDAVSESSGRQANSGRMIQNWAVLRVVFNLLHQFLMEQEAVDALPPWKASILDTVRTVQHERAGQVFIDTLGQLIASGQVTLADDMRNHAEPRPGTTIVGYTEDNYIYLLPEVAHREVNRGQPLKFTAAAIGAQLNEEGWLIPSVNRLTVQRRVRGITTRFWQLRAELLENEAIQGPKFRKMSRKLATVIFDVVTAQKW